MIEAARRAKSPTSLRLFHEADTIALRHFKQYPLHMAPTIYLCYLADWRDAVVLDAGCETVVCNI
jgi:hypothetical protein